jgi:predicted XRE-type DNA-binding protein
MDKALQAALKKDGWNVGDAADLLGLSVEQQLILDLRVRTAKAIREERTRRKMSQKTLADKLHSTQPRVARIEAAAQDVAFDLMLRALYTLGGRIDIRMEGRPNTQRKSKGEPRPGPERRPKKVRHTA